MEDISKNRVQAKRILPVIPVVIGVSLILLVGIFTYSQFGKKPIKDVNNDASSSISLDNIKISMLAAEEKVVGFENLFKNKQSEADEIESAYNDARNAIDKVFLEISTLNQDSDEYVTVYEEISKILERFRAVAREAGIEEVEVDETD